MLNLKNKYCLVTGCNGYIGLSITKKLKLLGAKVIGVDIIENKKNSNLFYFTKLDMENKKEIDQFIILLNKKFKKIDVLVNNAGYVGTSDINRKKTNNFFLTKNIQN